MAMKLRKAHRAGPMVEINMIPMIDVCLVLLIIFMVVTPMMVQQQIRVNLPKSVAATEVNDQPILVSIQREGEVSLNGRAVAVSSLENELKLLVAGNPERAVVIQADRDIALQKVISIMDIAKRLQVVMLGISVEQPKEPADRLP